MEKKDKNLDEEKKVASKKTTSKKGSTTKKSTTTKKSNASKSSNVKKSTTKSTVSSKKTSTKKNTSNRTSSKTTPKKTTTPKKKTTVKKEATKKVDTPKKIDYSTLTNLVIPFEKYDEVIDEQLEVEEKKKFKLPLFIMYYLYFIVLEVIYKLLIFGVDNLLNKDTISMLILDLGAAFIATLLTKLFRGKGQSILYVIINLLVVIWYGVGIVFKKIFNTFFCLSIFRLTDQAIAFTDEVISLTIKNIYAVVLILIPFIISIILMKRVDLKKKFSIKSLLIHFVLLLVICGSIFLCITYDKDEENSNYKLFYEVENNSVNVEKIGVLPSLYLDVKRLIFGFEEELILDNNFSNPLVEDVMSDEEISYGYNTVDIDFQNLIDNTKDKTLLNMHTYFMNDPGTLKNEYTGIFKDKNLVVIMAESLNNIAISEELTPTLYKLSNSSFIFENFYTPVNLSTIGGEFQDLTGLFANLSHLSNYWRRGNNYFPYGLGNIYKNAGYSVKAYHDNTYTFQDRHKYLKAAGFDYYKGRGNGLEKVMSFSKWPYSDYDMINGTYNEWINDERFMTYYISVSGHMPYSRGNAMVSKNWQYVKNLKVSDEAKGYVAANIELDRAVELLIEKLRESGKLDDTVIAIIPDHYPYNLSVDTINELSSYKRDGVIEINHSSLIIWNSTMEDVHVTKTASQLDFIPTLYNLFGLTYDSRLFMGKDIFSNSLGLVFFTNRSWVSDKGKYFASGSKFVPNEGEEVDKEYISKINTEVSNRINMSKLIIEKDYYRKVLP